VEIYVSDFVTYILLNQKNETDFDILYQDFVNVKLLSHEKNMISYNYPEYKALLNEYREGILLFDITNQNVWNKAVSDTIGLNQYFSNNKQNYMWSDRFEASIYTCSNKKIASKVKLQLFFSTSNDDILKSINKVSPLNLQIQSDIYEEQNNIYIEMSDKKLGLNSDILLDDGSIVLVYIKNIIPSRNKEISDVRGKVISDYQSYLEDQWIEKLRKKYTIKINKDVLYSLVKN
jgi:peptidyl-prolyl cis-trans isomerase SurA